MKYFKKLGIYKNSTGSNKFNPDTLQATSYNWWIYSMVVPIDTGKKVLVFNNYSYSSTTNTHQSETRSLLRLLEVRPHIILSFTNNSLDDPSCFKDELDKTQKEIDRLKEKIKQKGTWKSTNAKRRNTITLLKEHKKDVLRLEKGRIQND